MIMETLSIVFLVCASLVMIVELVEYIAGSEFDMQKFLGWVCACIWCINATWF